MHFECTFKTVGAAGAAVSGTKDMRAAWRKMGRLEAGEAVRRLLGLIRHDMMRPWSRLSPAICRSSYLKILDLKNRDFRFS